MPRLNRYTHLSISPTLERNSFTSVAEAIAHYSERGYKTNEFESRTTTDGKEIRVMVSSQNPRDYVEIVKNGFLNVNAIRHFA